MSQDAPPPADPITAQLPLATALLLAELERSLLADLVHDDVLQPLGAALLASETCEHTARRGHHDAVLDHLAALRQALDQGITRLRYLMADLRPYQPADQEGLAGALRLPFRLHEQRTGGSVEFQQQLDAPLGRTAQVLAYRLVLELLHSVRPGPAPLATRLRLRLAEGRLEIDARFQADSAEAPPLNASPLALVRWRVQSLGGSFHEDHSQPGVAHLHASLPVAAS